MLASGGRIGCSGYRCLVVGMLVCCPLFATAHAADYYVDVAHGSDASGEKEKIGSLSLKLKTYP
jgi:hypothetical protein